MRPRLPVIALSGVLLLGTAGALAQAEAERRLDAAIERLRTALGPEARIEIGGRRLDPVSGRATLTDVVIHRGADRTTIPEVILSDLSETRIGRAELRGVSERGGDGTAADTGRVVLQGFALPPAGQAFAPAAIAFEGIEVESFRAAGQGNKTVVARLALGPWRDMTLATGTLEGFDFRSTDDTRLQLRRVALEGVTLPFAGTELAPGAFRAGRIALEGLEFQEPTQAGQAALDRMELRDWAPGRLAGLVLEGLRGSGQVPSVGATEFRLGRIEASGIDAAALLDSVLNGTQAPDPEPGRPQRLSIEGLESRAEGQPLLAMRRLLSEGTLEAGIATGTLVMEGFRLTLPRGQAAPIEALGYREVAGGIEMRASVPRAGGRFDFDPMRIVWDEAMTLGLAIRLEGFPAPPAAGSVLDTDALVAGMQASQLGALTLTLRDQGLLGRVIAQQAREQRIPPARVREQWAQMVLAAPIPGTPAAQPARPGAPPPKSATGPDPFVQVRQAVAAFIRQPGTLEIALRPPTPVPLPELMGAAADPAGTATRLGLTATAR
jgi:hypothetical protein